MQTTGAIVALARDLQREHGRKPSIVVDDAGLGGGVVDRLREQREFKIVDYLGARRARAPRDYPNRRSEDWFALSEVLPLIDLYDDEELAADLLAPRYSLDSQGRRVVEAKAETKKRLRRSPDRADALVMALSVERPGQRPQQRRSSVPRGRIGDFGHGQRRHPLAAKRIPGVPDPVDGMLEKLGFSLYNDMRRAELAGYLRRGGRR